MVAWLSLDAADSDPARFWRHVAAALDRARPGISERVAPLFGPPAPSSFDGLVAVLINELAGYPGDDEALLVLDDYHLIGSQHVHLSLEFLLETSVLDRLSGELCDVVTGRAGSQPLLQQIEAAGLFLTPLDEVRGWWRYHHLFADLLRGRLQQEQPGQVAALHRNAAAWCAEHGLADDAVRHALSAGDPIGSARLIEQHFDEIFLQGESATIQRWLAALPAELARSRLRLALAQAWMALVGGDLEAAGTALDAAERAFADAADEPFEPSVGRAASLLANVPVAIALERTYLAVLYGDAEAAAASASQALAALGEGEWVLHSVSLWMLALGLLFKLQGS